jgi:hypothetical protein
MTSYPQLVTQVIPPADNDGWILLDWSTTSAPEGIILRCSKDPAPPPGNSTYGWAGVYQVAAGRLLVFGNQPLFALSDNGDAWGTYLPPEPSLLVNLPLAPQRYPWGIIVAVHRWMRPCTITAELVNN